MSNTDRETLDKETAESLELGLQQSATGETVSLGDFTQYVDDEPNRWESAGKLPANRALHVIHEYRDTL